MTTNSRIQRDESDRSIGAAVKAFNAVTGDGLMDSEERGWMFMTILEMVRSQQGHKQAEDLASYSALFGELACDGVGQNGNDGAVYYILEEVIGDTVLPDWARWVAVDGDGEAYAFSKKPVPNCVFPVWNSVHDSNCDHLLDLDPPLNFKNCIWEIKND
jgi:hypothetical protein